MKLTKEVQKMKKQKKQQRHQEAMSGQPDDLAMENSIKIRYGSNWPATILALTKRVQGVNQTWMQIINLIMFTEDLRITYAREKEALVVTIAHAGQVEQHEIPVDEVVKASQFIEVLVMNTIAESPIIRRLMGGQNNQ